MCAATVDKNQRCMLMALPFVFVLFVISFPAGLLVYWITTNLWTVGQQHVIRSSVGARVARARRAVRATARQRWRRERESAEPTAATEPTKPKENEPARLRRPPPSAAASAPPPPPRKKKKRSGRRR